MQTNPVKVIREKCLDCCCGAITEVAECGAVKCPLHPFRFGKNPYRKKTEMTEERREQLLQALGKTKTHSEE